MTLVCRERRCARSDPFVCLFRAKGKSCMSMCVVWVWIKFRCSEIGYILMSLIAWFQFICKGFGRSRLCQSIRIYILSLFRRKKTSRLKKYRFFGISSSLTDVSINSRIKFNFAIYRYQFRSTYPVVHSSLLHRFNLRIHVL